MPRAKTSRITRPSRRTRLVWASFLASMTLVTGVLALGEHSGRRGFAAANTSLVGGGSRRDPIFRTAAPLDRARWKGVIIHHSGTPAGDPEQMRRLHKSYGYPSLGYHFLIGNGNGMADGLIHVGERWVQQLPGAHTVGQDAEFYNQHAVGICLIGNGNRRPMTQQQMTQLVGLVRRLQRELGIPADAIRLHRDVAPGLTNSPGEFFTVAELEQHLLNPR